MNKIITTLGIGTALTAAAIAGGVGVAVAHGGDDHVHGQEMTAGTTMQMDPDTMQGHMRQILGDETYQEMQDAMKQVIGAAGYQQILDRMSSGCSIAMGTTMQGANAGPAIPGHDAHHAATN